MGVDGFRFDLAASLGRTADGFSGGHPLFAAMDTLITAGLISGGAEALHQIVKRFIDLVTKSDADVG